jgi:thiamine biosynthesis lipoprotein
MSSFDSLSKCIKISVLVFSFLLFAGCGSKKEEKISGKTMGTTYHITVVAGYFNNAKSLKEKIEARLEEINQSMSTYRKDSEITRFNAQNDVGEKVCVSEDFIHVMRVAEKLHALSEGAWDGTIKPLVDLWGFGSSSRERRVPEKEDILKLLPEIGFNNVEISDNRYLIKRRASISVDLASIAKGYAVDQIADLLRKNGIKNFLVEIGGEVFASGHRLDGKLWRVGINTPMKDAAVDNVYKAINLHNKALATSGDYRNFFEVNGKRFSHVLDPRTGYPVTNGVAGVSIIADTCVFADGLATAIMVMGHEKGIELIDTLPDVEGLVVVEETDGTLTDYTSKGFNLN